MNDIHKRTRFLVERLGPNPNAFSVKTGINIQMVHFVIGTRARKSKPGFNFIQKLLIAFPDVSLQWYLFGEGIWNGNDLKISKKQGINIKKRINELESELYKYKKLYSEERFINDALKEKIRRSIK